jgi:hypothetical protein
VSASLWTIFPYCHVSSFHRPLPCDPTWSFHVSLLIIHLSLSHMCPAPFHVIVLSPKGEFMYLPSSPFNTDVHCRSCHPLSLHVVPTLCLFLHHSYPLRPHSSIAGLYRSSPSEASFTVRLIQVAARLRDCHVPEVLSWPRSSGPIPKRNYCERLLVVETSTLP